MDAPTFTSALDRWWVKLNSGHTVDVSGHGVKATDDFLVFVALAKGDPNFEVALAAFPQTAVEDWGGGHPFDGTFPRVGTPLS